MKRNFKKGFIISCLFLSAFSVNAEPWKMKQAVLMTPYASQVDTSNVLGEYPRPQMVRKQWMNLNGIWQYQPASSFEQPVPAGKLSGKILVPFPVESAISGVMKHSDNLLYRRNFKVPAAWKGQRVLIHFGAVDYKSEVFVNGQSLGIHTGGYDPFTYDITSKLKGRGEQEITVKVFDPTDAGGQPRGKQTLNPQGIMYTCTSGIWQTVWLEPVPVTSISDIKIVPDVDKSAVVVSATTTGAGKNLTVSVEVKDGSKTVAKLTGNANADLTIPVPNPKLWSPNSPFLYDLKITLKDGKTVIDSLGSYFGMRKISMAKVGDFQKMMLNNEFLFQIGPLDQGFWPDGLYTPPTDLAIKNDLLTVKKAGYNMIRKHIKVEPYRWYYWADKLGILVWQDMPSANSYCDTHPEVDKVAYKSELERMIQTHLNIPSIIMWVVFNEGQGQHDTPELVAKVRELDPSRLINQASGNDHFGVGDLNDIHSYPPPACPTGNKQILACGEYGGIGYIVPDHTWKKGDTYVMIKDSKELLNLYSAFADQLTQYKTNNGLSAAVYTELTDVEIELNGIMTYDRKVMKADINKFYEINQGVINKNIYLTTLLPTSQNTARTWKVTTTAPSADWYKPTFDDSKWNEQAGGFGTPETPGSVVKTVWNTSDIWMRQSFNVGELTTEMLEGLMLQIHHDDECEVYINGVLAAKLNSYTAGYVIMPMTEEGKKALKPNAVNLISVHCNQTRGGQFIDAGLVIRSFDKK